MRNEFLAVLLAAAPLAVQAAYDANGVALGSPEREIRQRFPSAYCKALEWQSRAADRRCDDSRISFGGVEARVTFYLKKDRVEAFDVRFDTKEIERVVGFLKERYGNPVSEVRDTFEDKGRNTRQVYKLLWQAKGERAVLNAQLDKRRASLLVSRGDFEEEIYRVR